MSPDALSNAMSVLMVFFQFGWPCGNIHYCFLNSFKVILFSVFGSLLNACVDQYKCPWETHSRSLQFFLFSSLLCGSLPWSWILNSGSPSLSHGFSSCMSWPGNSLKAVSCRVTGQLSFILSLKDHCPLLYDDQCLENHCFICFN